VAILGDDIRGAPLFAYPGSDVGRDVAAAGSAADFASDTAPPLPAAAGGGANPTSRRRYAS